jgi:hypothetical protein
VTANWSSHAAEALAGRGRLVLCTGEAGIGKTRLAEELSASAATRNMPTAWARATGMDRRPNGPALGGRRPAATPGQGPIYPRTQRGGSSGVGGSPSQ